MIIQNFTGQYDLLGYYPVMSLLFIVFLTMLMVFCYLRMRVFVLMLIIFVFSLIIGVNSMSETIIPFTPYLQLFFLLFQTTLFVMVSIDTFKKSKGVL